MQNYRSQQGAQQGSSLEEYVHTIEEQRRPWGSRETWGPKAEVRTLEGCKQMKGWVCVGVRNSVTGTSRAQ